LSLIEEEGHFGEGEKVKIGANILNYIGWGSG
jgi:hypothetical protein